MAQPPAPDHQRGPPPHPHNVVPPFVQNAYGNYYGFPPGGVYHPQYMQQQQQQQPYIMAPHYPNVAPPAYPAKLPIAQMHAQQPPQPVNQPQPGPGTPTHLLRQRPNEEVHRGVFKFQTEVIEGNTKCLLEGTTVELVYKLTGDTGKASHLKTGADFENEMALLAQKALNARSWAVAVEIRNIAKAPAKKQAAKRKRDDDVPPQPTEEMNTQLWAYKQLSATLKCKAHHRHCFVDRVGGTDNHRCLSHAEMTLWAKKMVIKMSLGEATKYNPPHCLQFDHPATKKICRSLSSIAMPEVHVTIQNINGNGESVTLPGTRPVSARVVSGLSNETHPPQTPPMTAPDFGFIPPAFPFPEILTQPDAPLDSQPCINLPISLSSPEFVSSQMVKLLSMSGSDVFSSSTTAKANMLFPSVAAIISLLVENRPGEGFEGLETVLQATGIVLSPQIVIIPEEVLCIVANLNRSKARDLCNHTWCMLLPLLGFQESELLPLEREDEGKEEEDKDEESGRDEGGGNEEGDDDADGEDDDGSWQPL